MVKYKNQVLVCAGTGCRASQSEDIVQNLISAIDSNGIDGEVQVVRTGCFGFCE